MTVATDVSVPTFTVSFPEIKVKVQRQNRRSENLLLVIARPWFKKSSKLAVRRINDMKYNFR